MPTLSDLNRRYGSQNQAVNAVTPDESFIQDFRGSITPAQAVESKLGSVLVSKSTLFSRKRATSLAKPR